MTNDTYRAKTWVRAGFLLSTDPTMVPVSQLIAAFASKEFYWANPLPEDEMKQMLERSMIFAIYDTEADSDGGKSRMTTEAGGRTQRRLVGFGRSVTDFMTFMYLTDIWVKPSYQGRGLGAWMVRCIDEVLEEMPYLRRTLLFTADWERSVPFYEKLMGMAVLDCQPGKGLAIMEKKGRAHPSYGREGSSYT